MDAKPLSIGKILSERQRFIVPVYQRTYAWTRREIDPLIDQIKGKADELISNGSVQFSHYMGALLLIPEADPVFGQIQRFNVVDGQQRLTTFHLCFAALREIARTLGLETLQRQLADLVLHGDDVPMKDRRNDRYKLEPTRYDRQTFRDIVDLRRAELQMAYSSQFYKNGNIRGDASQSIWAYWHLCTEFTDYVGIAMSAAEARLRALSMALFEHFRLIVITLSKNDDAQVIFETLNSGGKPLAAMDLVRNDIFYRANKRQEDQESLLQDYWSGFEEKFWKDESAQGRIKKPRIDFFLSHALAAEQGRVMALGELFAEYKAFIRMRDFATTAEELITLSRYAPAYRQLVEVAGPPALRRLARRLAVFDVSTAYPLIMFIEAQDQDESTKSRLYDLIAAFIVRRSLGHLTTANYNNIFVDLVGQMRTGGTSEATLSAFFSNRKDTDASRFPDDTEFRTAVASFPQYGWVAQSRLRLILEELEFAARDKFNVNGTIQDGLQIEHIMPQQWMACWPLPDGQLVPSRIDYAVDGALQEKIETRNRLVQTLGNLTLLTPPANASASNSSFDDKRPRLNGSLLRLNVEVASHPTWDEQAITTRGKLLADLAVRLWPAPD